MNSLLLDNCQILTESGLEKVAILIAEEKIAKVVPEKDKSTYSAAKQKISLDNRLVLPGFIDAHMHLKNFANKQNQSCLNRAESLEELFTLIAQILDKDVNKKEDIVYLGRWNEEKYPERRMPTRQELDKICPDKALVLIRICGHSCVVNTKALKDFAWQSFAEAEPSSVGLDANFEPTGYLSETAMNAMMMRQKAESSSDLEAKLSAALFKLASYGLTAIGSEDLLNIHDTNFLKALENIYRKNPALPAYHAQIQLKSVEELAEFITLKNKYKSHPDISIEAVKLFKDGSLGSRSALLLEPYSDDPKNLGQDLLPYERLLEFFYNADEKGVQLMIHAIGDRAIAEIISAYEELTKKRQFKQKALRHSIIHCQITRAELLDRLEKTDLTVISQPAFVHSDWEMSLPRLDEKRRAAAYDYRGIADRNIHQAFSTDSPVESAKPLLTIAKSMKHPLGKDSSLSFNEAVKAYSEEAAFVLNQERYKGKIAAGYAADLVVLDVNNKAGLTPESIAEADIYLTMRKGKLAYKKS